MMFERKKEREEDLERARDDARRELDRERERLDREREALEKERERLERLQEELENRQDRLEDLADELDDQEEELEDAESVRDLLEAVSRGIPGVMRGIQEAVYSPEQSKQIATSIAAFYRTLVEAGIPDHQAQALTHTHMANLQHSTMQRTTRVRFPDIPHPPAPPEAEEGPDHRVHERRPHSHSGDHQEREA